MGFFAQLLWLCLRSPASPSIAVVSRSSKPGFIAGETVDVSLPSCDIFDDLLDFGFAVYFPGHESVHTALGTPLPVEVVPVCASTSYFACVVHSKWVRISCASACALLHACSVIGLNDYPARERLCVSFLLFCCTAHATLAQARTVHYSRSLRGPLLVHCLLNADYRWPCWACVTQSWATHWLSARRRGGTQYVLPRLYFSVP